jgi:hypothetical protein
MTEKHSTTSMADREAGCGKLVREGCHADGDSHSERAA